MIRRKSIKIKDTQHHLFMWTAFGRNLQAPGCSLLYAVPGPNDNKRFSDRLQIQCRHSIIQFPIHEGVSAIGILHPELYVFGKCTPRHLHRGGSRTGRNHDGRPLGTIEIMEVQISDRSGHRRARWT